MPFREQVRKRPSRSTSGKKKRGEKEKKNQRLKKIWEESNKVINNKEKVIIFIFTVDQPKARNKDIFLWLIIFKFAKNPIIIK